MDCVRGGNTATLSENFILWKAFCRLPGILKRFYIKSLKKLLILFG